MIALPVEGRRCLAIVQQDASALEKAAFAIVVTYMMGDFTYTEKEDTHYMCGPANGNGNMYGHANGNGNMYGHANGNGKTILR